MPHSPFRVSTIYMYVYEIKYEYHYLDTNLHVANIDESTVNANIESLIIVCSSSAVAC